MESHTHDENYFELIVLYMHGDGTDSYSTFISWSVRSGHGITVWLQLNTDTTI